MAKRVLIVEPATFMSMMLTDLLKKGGYEIAGTAPNGETGIEKYRELKPDLVFMEIALSGQDGLQTTKSILEEDPSAAVVLCSNTAGYTMIEAAREAGAKELVAKPFRPKEILDAAEKALGK